MTASYRTHEHDVIVVGAGGAGLRAAIEASARGARTALLSKSLLGKAHTVMAEGGVAAALGNADARDNWKVHFRDTMRGGKFVNQWKMAELHAKESPERVRELEAWGGVMDRNAEGWLNQRNFGGHTYPRLAHVGDRTGLEIIRTLQDKGVHSGIDVHMEVTAVRLFREGGGPGSAPGGGAAPAGGPGGAPAAAGAWGAESGPIAGLLAYHRATGEFHLFRAKAVVLATGGIGKSYQVTSNSWEYTGDGHALAYEAGADLMDMEFVQFHPTGMVWPPSVRGLLVTEGVRGEGGILRNAAGERFMYGNIPALFAGEFAESDAEVERWLAGDKKARRPPELLTRDEVARAIMREVRSGKGTPHKGVWLDISWRPAEYVKRKLPSMYHQFKELANVDITAEPMEVGPTMHYMMGGIRVDAETTESSVSGLFAAGEAAAGLHGANRLGGNSLSDLLVFGKRAGEHAAAHAARRPDLPRLAEREVEAALAAALAPLARKEGENPFAVQEALQETMNDHVGMVRDADGLRRALRDIEALSERAKRVRSGGGRTYNPGWHTALDLASLLVVAESIARHALAREESRGGHTRSDFPDTDKARWAKVNVVTRKGANGVMVVETRPLPEWPAEVRVIVEGTAEAVSSPLEAKA